MNKLNENFEKNQSNKYLDISDNKQQPQTKIIKSEFLKKIT